MVLKHLLAVVVALPLAVFAQDSATKPPPPLDSHEVHADRTITFRYRAPGAAKVEISLEGIGKPVPMTKAADGVWSYTSAALAPEIYGYNFLEDGIWKTDPDNHVLTPNMAFAPWNSVEVPGNGPQPWDLTAVPHGTLHTHRYPTKVAVGLAKGEEDVIVYTPPGYDARAKRAYPVLYLLHGWGGEAPAWTHDGQANLVLDNLLAAGKIKPMVVVMPAGYGDMSFVQNGFGIWSDPAPVEHNTQLFMQMLTTEIVPFVEANYHVSHNRNERAITGLSMGGLEALDTGLHHTELFAYVGGFSSAVHNLDYEHQLATLTPQEAKLKLLWIACGTEDNLIEANRKMSAFLKAKGLPVTEIETPGPHVWLVWRDNLVHFAPLLFQ